MDIQHEIVFWYGSIEVITHHFAYNCLSYLGVDFLDLARFITLLSNAKRVGICQFTLAEPNLKYNVLGIVL